MLIAAWAALAMLVQPVAADPEVACVLAQVPASALPSLLAEVRSGQGGPVRDAFRKGAAACGVERSWNAERTDHIGRRAAMLVLKEQAGEELERAGIPVAPIERWVAAQRQEGLDPENLSEAALLQLREELLAANVAAEVFDARGDDVGFYIATVLINAQLKAAPR